MDCDKINVLFVEKNLAVSFTEETVSATIVEETIAIQPVEETLEAQIVEEKLQFNIESSCVEYTGTKTSHVEHDIEAGEAINALKVIRNGDDNKAYIADSSDTDELHRVLGIAKISALIDNSVEYVISGILQDASWDWTMNEAIWFDNNGNLTQTPPASGFVKEIATPVTNKIINVNIKQGFDLA